LRRALLNMVKNAMLILIASNAIGSEVSVIIECPKDKILFSISIL